jgi:ABC-type polysaccharide/polyol phosphate transport system ATPase subunit
MLGVIADPPAGAALLDAIAGRRQPAAGSLDVRARVLSLRRPADGLEPELSVEDNAMLFGAYAGVRVDPDAIERAGLTEVDDEPLGAQPADAALRLVLSIVLAADGIELLLLDDVPPSRDAGFRDWAAHRTLLMRHAGTAIVQVARRLDGLVGAPDRLLDLEHRAVGHPGSVDDLGRRAALGLPARFAA